jgi:hypothetical protein
VYVYGGQEDTYGGFGLISKWNGSGWTELPRLTGGGPVSAIAVSGSNVYAGGQFSSAGGLGANNVAKWNGIAWTPLGSGVNGVVLAISLSGTDVLVGGNFTTAGCHVSAYFARYSQRAVTVSGRVVTPVGQGLRNAVVSIIDSSGTPHSVNTTTLGYYSISDIPAGFSYTVAVTSRRFRFTSRTIAVENDLTDIDFTGQE